jgi:DNA adenine methylase
MAQEHREYYQRVRDFNTAALDLPEIAARLIYLNKTCFNGLYRVNTTGQFNVPMGRYTNPTIYDPEALIAASQVLKGVDLVCKPFHKFLYAYSRRRVAPDTFIYLDPPYVPISKTSNFTGYTKSAFGIREQELLARRFLGLHKRGYKLMLSNSFHSDILDLYKDFRIEVVRARRAINSKATRRGSIPEYLVFNY